MKVLDDEESLAKVIEGYSSAGFRRNVEFI